MMVGDRSEPTGNGQQRAEKKCQKYLTKSSKSAVPKRYGHLSDDATLNSRGCAWFWLFIGGVTC